jgi:hypothetical protein
LRSAPAIAITALSLACRIEQGAHPLDDLLAGGLDPQRPRPAEQRQRSGFVRQARRVVLDRAADDDEFLALPSPLSNRIASARDPDSSGP